MSLDWNVSQVADSESVCFTGEKGNAENPKRLRIETEALIWLTLAVGMGKITADNWKAFYTRVSLYERVNKPMIGTATGSKPITLEDVKAHIGLTTNVSAETDAKWNKRLIENYNRDMGWQLKDK